jgi:DnaA family protein
MKNIKHMQKQLLDLFNVAPSFNNFITTNNIDVCQALKNNQNKFMNIIGGKLNGKTHLLKSWINHKLELNQDAIYVNINSISSDNIIRNLFKYYDYIAIDDIDLLDDKKQIEVFDLFNNIKLNNLNKFLVTSSGLNFENNNSIRIDLKTRILSGLNLLLRSPDDEEIMTILKLYIKNQGIAINDNEIKYMISHYTRNIGSLINTIRNIVEIAMLEKRNITIPFIKSVIEILN